MCDSDLVAAQGYRDNMGSSIVMDEEEVFIFV
jgi:hypothetical protein